MPFLGALLCAVVAESCPPGNCECRKLHAIGLAGCNPWSKAGGYLQSQAGESEGLLLESAGGVQGKRVSET